MQPNAMTTIFIVSSMPKNRMKIGTSTGGGMARKNSSTGSSRPRTVRLRPISTPRATETITASR